MARYTIWIVSPPNYPHSRCFEEVALGLESGLRALGHRAHTTTDPRNVQGTAIVLGANLLPKVNPEHLPKLMILFNLEQIQVGSPWLQPAYLQLLSRYPVWDYSLQNIAALAALGIRAQHCGIGYAPELTRIAPEEKTIDVLFIGSMNDRRKAVLDALHAHGIKVSTAFNCYGHARDTLIAQAKIVLNIHYYEARVFEIVRVSYLLANCVCVVSEAGNDPTLETPLANGIAFAPYDQLVQTVMSLLQNDPQREQLAQAGFAAFSVHTQAELLSRVLPA